MQTKGGYLVRINTQEEYAAIINLLQSNTNYAKKQFYIGGRREMDQYEYYWADNDNKLFGEALNSVQAGRLIQLPAGLPVNRAFMVTE